MTEEQLADAVVLSQKISHFEEAIRAIDSKPYMLFCWKGWEDHRHEMPKEVVPEIRRIYQKSLDALREEFKAL